MNTCKKTILKPTAIALALTITAPFAVQAKPSPNTAKLSSIVCPDMGGDGKGETVFFSAKTKNYRVKICGVENMVMLITKNGQTTMANIVKGNNMRAKRGLVNYEVIGEMRWNPGLEQDEFLPRSFRVFGQNNRGTTEKIEDKSIDGYFMLP